MSSLLWINEVEVYSGWHLETLFIQRWIFKAVWRKRLQQSSCNETWTKNLFWQPAKVVNSWKVRRACPPVSIQIQVLCKYTIPSSLTLLFLSDRLSYSVPLSLGSLILFSSPEGKWFDSIYPLLKDRLLPPHPPKATDFRKKLKRAFTDLCCVASTDVPSLALKASLLQMSVLNVRRLIWLLRIYVSPLHSRVFLV